MLFQSVLVLLLVIAFSGYGFWVANVFYSNLTPHFLLLQAFMLVGFLKIFESYSLPALNTKSNYRTSMSGILFLSWIAVLVAAISNFSEGRWITVSWILFAGGLSVVGAYFRNKIYIGI